MIITGAYGLVLAAMAYVPNVSYVAAFRQMSIPLGAILGVWPADGGKWQAAGDRWDCASPLATCDLPPANHVSSQSNAGGQSYFRSSFSMRATARSSSFMAVAMENRT